MQRHAMFLSRYTYIIEYHNTKRHTNADRLSKIPQEKELGAVDLTDVADIFALSHMEQLSRVTHQGIDEKLLETKCCQK